MTRARPLPRAENALLLAVASYPRRGAFDPALLPSLDWDYLTRAADRQGLTPLLDDWLAQQPGLVIPTVARTILSSTTWAAHFRNKALLHELTLILRAVTSRGLPVMPLKGALLAPCYYPTPTLRPLSDLDLLVRPGDVETLADIVLALGYRELPGPPYLLDEQHRDPLRRERAFMVERQGQKLLVEYRTEPLDPMVWQLTDLDPALVAGLHEHTARSWARAQQATLDGAGGAPFARLTAEDLLLHLASHLTTRHADFRLLWLHDICRVTAQHVAIDWEYVAREARALNLTTPVFAAFQAAWCWLDAPLPLRAIQAAFFGPARHPRSPLERAERVLLLRRIRAVGTSDLASPPPGEITRQVGSLVRLRGVGPRLRALRWLLAPGRDYTAGWRGERSDASYGLTVALRLVILSLQGGAAAGRLLGLRRLGHCAEGAIARIEHAARLEPFARYASSDDETATPSGASPRGRDAS